MVPPMWLEKRPTTVHPPEEPEASMGFVIEALRDLNNAALQH